MLHGQLAREFRIADERLREERAEICPIRCSGCLSEIFRLRPRRLPADLMLCGGKAPIFQLARKFRFLNHWLGSFRNAGPVTEWSAQRRERSNGSTEIGNERYRSWKEAWKESR